MYQSGAKTFVYKQGGTKCILYIKKGGGEMLTGLYEQNIDVKGRVSVPVRFRAFLGETFVASIGDENCVCLYPMDEWEAYMERVKSLSVDDRSMVMRYIQSCSAECDIDSQGRVVIPPKVRDMAELKKEIVVMGGHNRVEIWNRNSWNRYESEKIDMNRVPDLLKQIGF